MYCQLYIIIEPLHEKTYDLVKIFYLYFFAQKLSVYFKWSSSSEIYM